MTPRTCFHICGNEGRRCFVTDLWGVSPIPSLMKTLTFIRRNGRVLSVVIVNPFSTNPEQRPFQV